MNGHKDELAAALQSRAIPTDYQLATLMRMGQWALDEAAHGLIADDVTPEHLTELAAGLQALAGEIAARAERGPAPDVGEPMRKPFSNSGP